MLAMCIISSALLAAVIWLWTWSSVAPERTRIMLSSGHYEFISSNGWVQISNAPEIRQWTGESQTLMNKAMNEQAAEIGSQGARARATASDRLIEQFEAHIRNGPPVIRGGRLSYRRMALALAIGLCLEILLLRMRGTEQRRAGHCVGCGFDLRASTGRCPECGKAFSAGSTAPTESRARKISYVALALVPIVGAACIIRLGWRTIPVAIPAASTATHGPVWSAPLPKEATGDPRTWPTTGPVLLPAQAFQHEPNALPGFRNR